MFSYRRRPNAPGPLPVSLSHRKLAAWYPQLAQQLEAGLAFTDALRSSRGTGMPEIALEAMAQAVETGNTVQAALDAGAAWLPEADRLMLAAAAEAGRFTHVLQNLATRHSQVYAAQLKLGGACLYPVGVLHLGLLLRPILGMIDWEKGFAWNTVGYVAAVARPLVPFWGAVILVVMLARRGNRHVAALGRALPILGRYFRLQGLSDFAFALGSFLDAGMPIDRAWTVSGMASKSPDLRRAAETIGAVIARGERPGPRLATLSCFPADFSALYHTGESTGQLDQNLLHLARLYRERADRTLLAATFAYSALLFLVVALFAAFTVLQAYSGYFKMIGNLAS
jgi:type II secretory pathway component PulF